MAPFNKAPNISITDTESNSISEKNIFNIPEWIKNNAKWWSDGIISDQDFVSGIEFMIKEKIIESPSITLTNEKLETESNQNLRNIPDSITPGISLIF